MGAYFSNYAVGVQERWKLPKWVAFHLLHAIARLLGFWGPNVVLFLISRYGLFSKYKIQGERMPSRELVKSAVKHNVIVDLASYYMVSFIFYKVFTTKVESKRTKGQNATDNLHEDEANESITNEAKAKGWANLRMSGPAPSAPEQFVKVLLAYFGYDAMFYWSHRILHLKPFYLPIHKKHHKFHTPTGPSAAYEHGLESAAQLLNWYVPLGLVGYFSGDLHASTVFCYHLMRWTETVDAHCGYIFPFSPYEIFPIFGGARMHDLHHQHFFGNYGATPFWDWLCGTQLLE